MRRLFLFLFFFLGATPLTITPRSVWPKEMPPTQSLAVSDLVIETSSGVHNFEVEVARTSKERGRGLMFRHEMPASHGMLFLFPYPQPISMWMKNTYIPLDMLFILPDGTISQIIENTEPLSLKTHDSRGASSAVLELVAGTVKKLGICEGDLVRHKFFSNEL